LTLRTLRNIKKVEELTYNYNTTEFDIIKKFKCECNSKNCFHKIEGFKYLTLEQKKKLKPFLSPFLKKKFEECKEKW